MPQDTPQIKVIMISITFIMNLIDWHFYYVMQSNECMQAGRDIFALISPIGISLIILYNFYRQNKYTISAAACCEYH